ncbi:MAG: hypothetical protein HY825_04180 [Acidobacteria bacterium]|nr:hypothetical protein [Acidobacteriota bacterium]
MSRKTLRSLTARVVLLTLAPWCAGCATEIYSRSSTVPAGPMGRGRLEVRVFDDATHRKQNLVSLREVVTELYRLEAGEETLVREARTARWSADDLAPGRYRLHVGRWIGEDGATHALPHDQDETFAISATKSTVADVVLKDGKKATMWIAIAGTVIAVLAYGYNQMSHWDPLGDFEL